ATGGWRRGAAVAADLVEEGPHIGLWVQCRRERGRSRRVIIEAGVDGRDKGRRPRLRGNSSGSDWELLLMEEKSRIRMQRQGRKKRQWSDYRLEGAEPEIRSGDSSKGQRRVTIKGSLQGETTGLEENLLGTGGFGQVYKGVLCTGEAVAIKKMTNNSRQGMKEFIREVASLGRVRHRHLVQLKGWCKRNEELFLASELWCTGDIKSSNIQDADMNARLGYFGLARLFEHGTNPHTTHVVGTGIYRAGVVAHREGDGQLRRVRLWPVRLRRAARIPSKTWEHT
ncbi:hypothetical protein GW17_00045688, partial [Ensete ventricosum]